MPFDNVNIPPIALPPVAFKVTPLVLLIVRPNGPLTIGHSDGETPVVCAAEPLYSKTPAAP